MRVNKYRLEKMVKVTDNWYPCIDGNKIRISMTIMYSRSKIINHHHVIIIAVGDDDYGLELCYKNKHFRKLLSKYNTWKKEIFNEAHDGIDKNWFIKRGFVDL